MSNNDVKNDAVTAVEVVKKDTVVYEDGDFEDYNADKDYEVSKDANNNDLEKTDKKQDKSDKADKKDADSDKSEAKADGKTDKTEDKSDKADKKDDNSDKSEDKSDKKDSKTDKAEDKSDEADKKDTNSDKSEDKSDKKDSKTDKAEDKSDKSKDDETDEDKGSKKEQKSQKEDKSSKKDKASKKDKSDDDDKSGITMAGIYQWASKLKDDFKSEATDITQDVTEKAAAMTLGKLLDAVDLELAAFDKSIEVAKNLIATAEERRKKIAAKKEKYQGMIDKLDK